MAKQQKMKPGSGNQSRPIGAEKADLLDLLGDEDLKEVKNEEKKNQPQSNTPSSIITTPTNDNRLKEPKNKPPKSKSELINKNCFDKLRQSCDNEKFRELFGGKNTTVNIPADLLGYVNAIIEYQGFGIKEFNAMIWYDFIIRNKKELEQIELINEEKNASKKKNIF